MSHWTEIWPAVPTATMALLARTIPVWKLMALASGAGLHAGKRRRSPALEGWKTARLIATALAEDGIPQRPVTGKVRTVFADSAGPPDGPGAFRVSATRQGDTVT